jgi:hypothetical protein
VAVAHNRPARAQANFRGKTMSGITIHPSKVLNPNPNQSLGEDVQEDHDQQSEVFSQYQCRSLSFGKEHPGDIAGSLC